MGPLITDIPKINQPSDCRIKQAPRILRIIDGSLHNNHRILRNPDRLFTRLFVHFVQLAVLQRPAQLLVQRF
ncbi:hypothetical protein D3C78_1143000 [compost metagenome]